MNSFWWNDRTCLTRAIAVLTFAAAPWPTSAQVNIEALRPQRTDSGIVGTLGTDLLLRTGNVSLIELGIDARIERLSGKSVLLVLVNADLGFLEGERFTNDGLAHVRYGLVINRTIMLEGYGQANYDKSRLLDFRALLGGGVRVSLVDAAGAGLAVGSGLMFEHESLGLPITANHPRRTDASRSSSYLSVRITASPGFVFTSTGYAQPRVDDLMDIRILNKSGIAVAVSDKVTLRTQFGLRYDSRPPDGVVRLSTELTNGVAMRF